MNFMFFQYFTGYILRIRDLTKQKLRLIGLCSVAQIIHKLCRPAYTYDKHAFGIRIKSTCMPDFFLSEKTSQSGNDIK